MSILKTKFGPGWLATVLLGAPNGVAGLDSGGKVPIGQLPASVTAGGIRYKGTFDASTGSYPASPADGDLYRVTVAGTVSGVVYTIGDYILYSLSETQWDKIESSRTSDELPEGTTNLYFTTARAQTAAVQNSLAASTVIAPSASAVNTALAGKAASFTRTKERYVLSSTDITNQYVILNQAALARSITAGVQGLGLIEESLDGTTGDYAVTIDGGTTHTKMTFKNDRASGGASPLAAGDVIYVQYEY